MPTCTSWTALAVRPLPAALSIVDAGDALPTLVGFRWLMLNLRRSPCWCRGQLARSDARSLASALPVTFSLLVLSDLFSVPNELSRVPGGRCGHVWFVPVDGLGIGEGLLRYNRLEH